MKKLAVVLIALVALGSVALADTITGGSFSGNNVLTPVTPPAAGTLGNPNWDGASRDVTGSSGSCLNIGCVLTGSNAASTLNTNFLTSTVPNNTTPGNYLGAAAASNALAPNFNFVREASSVTVTLIYANSGANTFTGANAGLSKQIGFYDATCATFAACALSEQVIYGVGTLSNSFNGQVSGFSPTVISPLYANYGIYMTTCSTTVATGCYTAFSNSTFNNSGASDTSHQHMSLFRNAQDARQFYVGFEDGLLDPSFEQFGDYNDAVIRIQTAAAPPPSVPEPATLSIMGLGLLSLGFVRRFRK